VNLLHLDYFRTVAKYQSVTKAAEELHITQPSLSNSLRRLEDELGIKLFERRGRALVLSSDGAEFLKSVNSIFSLLGSKNQLASLTGSEDCAEITIGSLRTETALNTVIAEYSELHPNVLFRTIAKPRLDNSRWTDVADFVISPHTRELAGKHKCRLPDTEQYVLLPSVNPLSWQDEVDIRDLSDIPQILVAPPDVLMPKVLSLAMKAGLKPHVRYISEDRFSALCMLLQGKHVMLMPREDAMTVSELSGGRIVSRPLTSDKLPGEWKSEVYLSWGNPEEMSPQAIDFLEYTMERLDLEEI